MHKKLREILKRRKLTPLKQTGVVVTSPNTNAAELIGVTEAKVIKVKPTHIELWS